MTAIGKNILIDRRLMWRGNWQLSDFLSLRKNTSKLKDLLVLFPHSSIYSATTEIQSVLWLEISGYCNENCEMQAEGHTGWTDDVMVSFNTLSLYFILHIYTAQHHYVFCYSLESKFPSWGIEHDPFVHTKHTLSPCHFPKTEMTLKMHITKKA